MIAMKAQQRLTWKERWNDWRDKRRLETEQRREEQRKWDAGHEEREVLRTQLYTEVDRVAKFHTEDPILGIFSVFSMVPHYQKVSGWPLAEVEGPNDEYPKAYIWRTVSGAIALQVGHQYHWGVEYPFLVSYYPTWSGAETLREHIAALETIKTN